MVPRERKAFAEWTEELHPRDDNGRFAPSDGGGNAPEEQWGTGGSRDYAWVPGQGRWRTNGIATNPAGRLNAQRNAIAVTREMARQGVEFTADNFIRAAGGYRAMPLVPMQGDSAGLQDEKGQPLAKDLLDGALAVAANAEVADQYQRYADIYGAETHWQGLDPADRQTATDHTTALVAALAARGEPLNGPSLAYAAERALSPEQVSAARSYAVLHPEEVRDLYDRATKGDRPPGGEVHDKAVAALAERPPSPPPPAAVVAENARWAEREAAAQGAKYPKTPAGLPILPGTKVDSDGWQNPPAPSDEAYGPDADLWLTNYHGSGYQGINNHLRYFGVPTRSDAELTKWMDESRTPEDLTVFRSLHAYRFAADGLQPGMVFQDHGYVSTDVQGATALKTTGDTLFAIHVPKGSQGVYKANHLGEAELTLQRGSTFRVLGKTGHKAPPAFVGGPKRDVWHVELVAQPDWQGRYGAPTRAGARRDLTSFVDTDGFGPADEGAAPPPLQALTASVATFEWDSEKHPRGQPNNAGQFIPADGGGSGGDRADPDRPTHPHPKTDAAFAKAFTKGPGPKGVSATEAEQLSRVRAIYDNHYAFKAARKLYDTTYTHVDQGYHWTAERSALHDKILDEFAHEMWEVPSDRQLVTAGGLGGAGKTTILTQLGERLGIQSDGSGKITSHVVINADDFKERLFRHGAIPDVPGWTPAEASTFVHEEAVQLADRASRRASYYGKNVIWDMTMRYEDSISSRTGPYLRAGYDTKALFVDVSVDQAQANAQKRHAEGFADFVKSGGTSFGGRYVPRASYDEARPPHGSPYASGNRYSFEKWRQANPKIRTLIVDNEGWKKQVVQDSLAARLAEVRRLAATTLAQLADWDPDKHPRGQPNNAGQFIPVDGGGGADGGGSDGGQGGDRPRSTPPGNWTTHPEEWARHTYEMATPTFSTKVIKVDKTEYGTVNLVGSIHDQTGQRIGEFNRTIQPEWKRASHTWLEIDHDQEGQGIAAAFNAQAEEAYRRAGIEQIDLVANISVGGYAWAKAGYEWRGPAATEFAGRLRDLHDGARDTRSLGTSGKITPYIRNASREDDPILRQVVTEHHKDLYTPAVAAKVAELAKDPYPTAADIVHLGLDQGAVVRGSNGQRYWLGKLLLLGSEWEGSKRLTPARAKAAASSATSTFAAQEPPPMERPDPAVKARLKAKGAPDYNVPPVDWEDKGDDPIEFLPPSREAKLAAVRRLAADTLGFDFDPDKHPRDEKGRFGPGDGGAEPTADAGPATMPPERGWETDSFGWAEAAYQVQGDGWQTKVEEAVWDQSFDTSSASGMELRVRGTIEDTTGNKIGEFQRTLTDRENEDGSIDRVMTHDLLLVNPDREGHGIASRINAQAEAVYRATGVTRIDVHANISVGGYAWAKAGYEWDDAAADNAGGNLSGLQAQFERFGGHTRPIAVGEHMTPMLSELDDKDMIQAAVEEHHAELLTPAVMAKVAELAHDYPTADQMVRLGLDEGAVITAENGQRYWLGKLMLLGSDWQGSKRLAPALPAGAVTKKAATATTAAFAARRPDPALKARLKAAGAPDYNHPPVDWEDKGTGPVEFLSPAGRQVLWSKATVELADQRDIDRFESERLWQALTPAARTAARQAALTLAATLGGGGVPLSGSILTAVALRTLGEERTVAARAYGVLHGQELRAAHDAARQSVERFAEWNEADHPRDDDGRFGTGAGAQQTTDLGLPILGGTKVNPDFETGPEPRPEEYDALGHYQSSGYESMNGGLRSGSPPSERDVALTGLIDAHEVPEDVTVFRSLNLRNLAPNGKLNEGLTFTDHGFVSTDAGGGAALEWGGDTMLAIRVPKGTKGARFDSDAGEQELILQRGTTFRVTGRGPDLSAGTMSSHPDMVVVHVEVVGQPTWPKEDGPFAGSNYGVHTVPEKERSYGYGGTFDDTEHDPDDDHWSARVTRLAEVRRLAATVLGQFADWNPDDHPRDDNGRFAPKGGGGSDRKPDSEEAAAAKPYPVVGGGTVRPLGNRTPVLREDAEPYVDNRGFNYGTKEWRVDTKDGNRVTLRCLSLSDEYTHPEPSPEAIHALLNGVADAYEDDPVTGGRPPDIDVWSPDAYAAQLRRLGESPERAEKAKEFTRASIFPSDPFQINVIHNASFDKPMRQDGWVMPAVAQAGHQGLVAHEYGHLRHLHNADSKDEHRLQTLYNNKPFRERLSVYGQSHPYEAQAEAYAEWTLTRGTTKNQSAKTLAIALGWERYGHA